MSKKSILFICTVAVMLTVMLCLSLTGCGKKAKDPADEQTLSTSGDPADEGSVIPGTTEADQSDPTVAVSGGVGQANDGEYNDATENGTEETTLATSAEEETEQTGTTTPAAGSLTYAQYLALSKAEKIAYYQAFDDPEAFTLWFNQAQKEYNGNVVEVGNGPIDLEDILNP